VSTSGYEATAAEALRVDAVNACIWRGETPLPLTPKSFAVLRYLMEHPRRLVTKRELLDAAWAGTYVGDAVLKVAVLKIRKGSATTTTPRSSRRSTAMGIVGEADVEVEVEASTRAGGSSWLPQRRACRRAGDVLLRLTSSSAPSARATDRPSPAKRSARAPSSRRSSRRSSRTR
jgi:hypothetical protein